MRLDSGSFADNSIELIPAHDFVGGDVESMADGLLMAEEDFDGAERVALEAIEKSRARPVGAFFRRVSEVEHRRKNIPLALDWAREAIAIDARDAWSQSHLAGLLFATGDLDGAESAARLALELDTGLGAEQFRRLLNQVEMRRASLVA